MKTFASLRCLLVPAFSLAISCTTSSGGKGPGGERREIIGLEEMSLEYIQSNWGTPETSTPSGDGKTVRFKGIRTETEEPVSGKVSVKYCDIRLELNKNQLVKSWEYESCRPQ